MLFTKKRTNLEKEIDRVIQDMSAIDSKSDDYVVVSTNLERLYQAKANEGSKRVSPDAIVTAVGSLLGIVLILNFEKAGAISSKALSLVLKGRV